MHYFSFFEEFSLITIQSLRLFEGITLINNMIWSLKDYKHDMKIGVDGI